MDWLDVVLIAAVSLPSGLVAVLPDGAAPELPADCLSHAEIKALLAELARRRESLRENRAADIADAMRCVGIRPAMIHAHCQTGLLVSEGSRAALGEEALRAWDQAIREYVSRATMMMTLPIAEGDAAILLEVLERLSAREPVVRAIAAASPRGAICHVRLSTSDAQWLHDRLAQLQGSLLERPQPRGKGRRGPGGTRVLSALNRVIPMLAHRLEL